MYTDKWVIEHKINSRAEHSRVLLPGGHPRREDLLCCTGKLWFETFRMGEM